MIEDKISQAKARLLLEYPLFGSIATKIELLQNDNLQNFKTNGIKLEYNSDFLANLEPKQLMSVLANSAMHISLKYELRGQNRSNWLWQLAFDYAINDMLLSSNFEPFEGINYQKRFDGMYAEQIYAILADEILRDDLEPNEGEDRQDSSTQNDSLQDEQLFGEMAKSILDDELKKGEKLEFLSRFFSLKSHSNINWRDELKAALTKDSKDNYTLLPPNKKLLYSDIYLPSCISQKFYFTIAIDSSGSIDEVLLGEFVSEINYILSHLTNYEMDLLVCDSKVHLHQKYYSGDNFEVAVVGGGATDFRAVFEFIEKEIFNTSLLIYFSDLDGIFPKNAPNYEVLWVSKSDTKPPFGDLLSLV